VLKELAPGVRRAAVVHHPDIAANVAFVRAAEAASSTFGVTITSAAVRNAKDIEETITKFAQEPNGGLVVAPAPPTFNNRELVVALAARFFSSAGRLFIPFLCHKWRTGLVWLRPERYMAGCRCLCRPCSTRRKTRRFAGATARQVSAGDQSEDREGARAEHPTVHAVARRRGDRITTYFAAPHFVRLWHKADVPITVSDVRFRG